MKPTPPPPPKKRRRRESCPGCGSGPKATDGRHLDRGLIGPDCKTDEEP